MFKYTPSKTTTTVEQHSTSGPVSTGMGDRSQVRVAFAPFLYLVIHRY